jgi:lipopolysaccharide biosynthesis regulator YciM
MSGTQENSTLQNWLFYAVDGKDNVQEAAFESDLARLLGEEDLAEDDQWHLAVDLEHRILTGSAHPSRRQLARFWSFRARQYLRRNQFIQGFEALSLCERNISREDTAICLYVHSMMVHLSLHQGHYIQSLLSASTVTESIQELAPHFIAAQARGSALIEAPDDVSYLGAGGTTETDLCGRYMAPS